MSEPMYRQIADALQRQIDSGELQSGAQLKSEVELREEYAPDGKEVSRNTVRDAIKLLIARGLVETRPGKGTFVLRKVQRFVTELTQDPAAGDVEAKVYKSEAEQRGREIEDTRPRVEVQPADDLVARWLELAEGAQVISRHQRRRIDGTPCRLQTTYYPMDLLQRDPPATRLLEATSIEEGAIQYLREELQINQVGWLDNIIARPPSADERTFFNLSDKVQIAMFESRRTGYDENGKPIRYTVTVYPADRNQFELVAGRVPSHETSAAAAA